MRVPTSSDPRFREGKFQGMNAVIWPDGGNTLILAGDRPPQSLINTVLHKVVR
jgi:hypothetical protein